MSAHFPPPPPAAVTRVLSRFDRDQLAGFIEIAIDLLDVSDGDSDVEANGDELDGTGGEDDFIDHYGANMGGGWSGPGCRISDPDCCPAHDDIGTDHDATRRIWFDRAAARYDEDAEDTFDREATNEDGSDPIHATPLRYGPDQSKGPANSWGVVL